MVQACFTKVLPLHVIWACGDLALCRCRCGNPVMHEHDNDRDEHAVCHNLQHVVVQVVL